MKHKRKKEDHEHSGDNVLLPHDDVGEPTSDIIVMTKQLLDLETRYDEAKKLSSQLYEQKEKLELELYERMKDVGINQFRTAEFGLISCANTLYGKITDLPTAEKWLQENGLYNELLKLTPIKGRINELLKKRIEEGKAIPPGFDYILTKTISHRST